MPRKKLIPLVSCVALALVCYAASVTYQNYLLKRQISRLEQEAAVSKRPPVTLAFDFPTTSVATDDYGVDRGMKVDEMQFGDRASSRVGVPWDVERAMIPTKKNLPLR